MTRFVLAGGGVAAAATAAGLRSRGYDGRLVLVSDELHLPYERPPLSKEFLSGKFGIGDFPANPQGWYADNDVEVLLGTRVDAIDPAGRRVTLSDGGSLAYDALVVATGVRARTLPGFAGDRVHSLRSIADSERLGSRLTPGSRLVILGAGFIGCEVAAIAAARGVRVAIFEPEPVPLARALGPQFGAAMIAIHREHGVEIRAGQLVTEMKETAAGLELRTRDGETVECDELLVGVGSVPNAELAIAAGITVDGGIVTDEFGRTSAPGVYALGDVASRHHPAYGRAFRVEHHDTAMRHGGNAARNLLGEAVPFSEEHYFWSDQYDHSIKSVGHGGAEAAKILRGSVPERSFSVFSLENGRVTSVVTLDRPQDFMATRKLLAVPHQVTADQLADPGFDLRSLLPRRPRTRRSEASR
ncbi:FAD-dependent oxidoreductase [Amycolatopsis sp. K13G38]|uniref:FAD-dependent oxidoreductase n=1 Tax=Amycolatopsis acididurans TaxID=2724524 RepID=A0ABX1JD75_9PSEU|nr:FAD-dependent oxidoreductase [Amycolatopsis acididurans]NKQ57689.1 FAD-dependent oxidoreductase [Amycolatopsis acididurans]